MYIYTLVSPQTDGVNTYPLTQSSEYISVNSKELAIYIYICIYTP